MGCSSLQGIRLGTRSPRPGPNTCCRLRSRLVLGRGRQQCVRTTFSWFTVNDVFDVLASPRRGEQVAERPEPGPAGSQTSSASRRGAQGKASPNRRGSPPSRSMLPVIALRMRSPTADEDPADQQMGRDRFVEKPPEITYLGARRSGGDEAWWHARRHGTRGPRPQDMPIRQPMISPPPAGGVGRGPGWGSGSWRTPVPASK
jgi:hypothetical protein